MNGGTIIYAECGNISYVKGLAPNEIEPLLVDAIRDDIPFVYLESNGQSPNSFAIAPKHVVALIRHENMA